MKFNDYDARAVVFTNLGEKIMVLPDDDIVLSDIGIFIVYASDDHHIEHGEDDIFGAKTTCIPWPMVRSISFDDTIGFDGGGIN